MKNYRMTAIRTVDFDYNYKLNTVYMSELQEYKDGKWQLVQTLFNSNLASLIQLQNDTKFYLETVTKPVLKLVK